MLALSAINLEWWFRSSRWVCEKVYYVQSKGNVWQYNICKDINNTVFLKSMRVAALSFSEIFLKIIVRPCLFLAQSRCNNVTKFSWSISTHCWATGNFKRVKQPFFF